MRRAARPRTLSAMNKDALASHWAWALDAAGRALEAGDIALPAAALTAERHRLAEERPHTAALLGHWLPSGPVTPRTLGLPDGTHACILDLEGVLTDGGVLQAAAWAETLEPLLLRLSHHDRPFIPFTPDDYRAYFEGRPRIEGIELFLAGRGLHLGPTDVRALARRKGEVLAHGLQHRQPAALPGARRYLESAGFAHLRRVALSASTSARRMADAAGLGGLVDAYVGPAGLVARDPQHTAVITRLDQVVRRALDEGMTAIRIGSDAPSLAALVRAYP